MLPLVSLPHGTVEVDRPLNHVFHSRDRGDVGLVASGRAHQVDHIFGDVNPRHRDVAVFIGIRMSGEVAFWRLGIIHANFGDLDAGQTVLRVLESRAEGLRASGFEDDVAAAVRTAFGRARGFGVCEILGKDLGAGTLRGHAGGADRDSREKTH